MCPSLCLPHSPKYFSILIAVAPSGLIYYKFIKIRNTFRKWRSKIQIAEAQADAEYINI